MAVKALLFGAIILLAGCPGVAASYPYGLWVEAEGPNQTLDDLGRLEGMGRTAADAGITNLYLQVYRGGRSWYASDLADDEPYRRAIARQRYDPLQFALGLAPSKGLLAHAWMKFLHQV